MDNTILVVDDEQDFLESARRGLIAAGFKRVKTERYSQKASEFFKKGESADIALIDITMPGMSGIELLEVIKRTSPKDL